MGWSDTSNNIHNDQPPYPAHLLPPLWLRCALVRSPARHLKAGSTCEAQKRDRITHLGRWRR